ncbi:SDR family oxidoreductase [Polluticoccus soli]|uniref:SDR family oxidoreductase n=1 Tax=Polluticoccus soli TaxID=3034150 RepID=UPI0023E2FECF|nr:SDR family oxidoreductase [Flavipsychrobacter sp. JY13-12]
MLSLSLEGKTALIAGSTQGIGFASAQSLASLGANCVLIARNEEALKKAVAELDSSKGQKHSYLVADFSQPQQVGEQVGKLVQQTTVHILVNNSGGPAAGPIVDAKPEAFLAAFNQHLVCNHILTTAVMSGMKQAGYGRIINVISTSVKIPLKGLGVSNTIRGAVASWAKTMANELGQFGITVNNVLPGATATGRLDAIINNKASKTGMGQEEVEKEMLEEIPAKRFGQPEEIASLIAFLASGAAGYINGTSIPVDGGRTGSI